MGDSWGAAGGFFADADFDYGSRIVLAPLAADVSPARRP